MSGEFYEFTIDKFLLRVKKGLLYTKDDVWVHLGPTIHKIGLTDYAQRTGGDIVFIDFPTELRTFEAGESLAEYETIKAVLDVKAPFKCRVTEYNAEVSESPELINEDPYGQGWVAGITPLNDAPEKQLLTAEEYFEHMKVKAEAEAKKLKGIKDD